MGNSSPDSFDGIKETLADFVYRSKSSLNSIVRKIIGYKQVLDPVHFESLMADIALLSKEQTEMGDKVEALYRKAINDRTGLHTRLYFDEWLARLSNCPDVAFVMSDLDKFHDYNEKYGHLQGDIAVQCAADAFMQTLKQTKQANEQVFTARYGGEEYCALLWGIPFTDMDIKSRIENVRLAFEKHEIPRVSGSGFADELYKHSTLTIAGGIRKPGEELTSLVRKVDDALKDAKRNNQRNQSFIA